MLLLFPIQLFCNLFVFNPSFCDPNSELRNHVLTIPFLSYCSPVMFSHCTPVSIPPWLCLFQLWIPDPLYINLLSSSKQPNLIVELSSLDNYLHNSSSILDLCLTSDQFTSDLFPIHVWPLSDPCLTHIWLTSDSCLTSPKPWLTLSSLDFDPLWNCRTPCHGQVGATHKLKPSPIPLPFLINSILI